MFERVIKLVREEKVFLFIGAGFSLKAGAPSAQALCNAILSEYNNEQQRSKWEKKSLAEVLTTMWKISAAVVVIAC